MTNGYASFVIAIGPLLKNEGIFSNSKYDKGKKTRFGITEFEMRLDKYWGAPEEYPKENAINLYERKYWKALSLDKINDQGLAEMIFDAGVNMGTGTIGRFVQRAVNVLNRNQRTWLDLLMDGLVGPKTAASINILSPEDLCFLKIAIFSIRNTRYIDIADGSDQEMNLRSWLRRGLTIDLIETIQTLIKGK